MSTSDTDVKPIDRALLFESIFVMVFSAVTYTFDKVSAILAQGIQPTVFPRAVLLIMFVLAALQAYRATRLSPQQVAEPKPVKAVPPIVFLTAGFLIAFAAVMPIIGTFPAIVIFLPRSLCSGANATGHHPAGTGGAGSARRGGYMNRRHEGPPGRQTFWKGYALLMAIATGCGFMARRGRSPPNPGG